MRWINYHNVLVVGLGLIGGSYAKSLKRLGYHIMAVDSNPESIQYAIENNVIDEGAYENIGEIVSKADCIIMALYPSIVKDWVEENQKYFKKGIPMTDVTGVKSSVVYSIQSILREDVEYVAAHPMAGREVSGVKNSDDRIFRNANYIVVPTEKNTEEGIQWCENLGRILGFDRITVLSPEEHDDMIAYVSQLTHCIAVALMTSNDNDHLSEYTGDSFRDLTRIANINENMWTELFFMNKEPLLHNMDMFIEEFQNIRDMIANEDSEALKEKMRLSTKRRAKFDKNK